MASSARKAAREALTKVLWDKHGKRRLPGNNQLENAINACKRGDVWEVCELNPFAPIYLLPTREWIRALAEYVDTLGVKTVLEVAAGDGFLSRCLAAQRPKLRVIATDDASWVKPQARMSDADRVEFAGHDIRGLALGDNVEKLSAQRSVEKYKPDLVLVSWAPPGRLVQRALLGPCKYVLDFGTDGDVCGSGPTLWRKALELVDGPVEQLAWCRLDERSDEPPRTRITLYAGARYAKPRKKKQ